MHRIDRNYQNPKKAHEALHNLDDARTKGDIDAIPEALRKVVKHAPKRTLLHETIRVEQEITRQTTRSSNVADYEGLGPGLVALELEIRPVMMARDEDVFQARVTQGVAAFWLGHYDKVKNLIGYRLEEELDRILEENGIAQKHTYVSLAQGSWARGAALVKLNTEEALKWFKQMFRVLTTKVPREMETDGFRQWFERFLAAYCLTLSHFVRDHRDIYAEGVSDDWCVQPKDIMPPFHAWDKFISGSEHYPVTQQRLMPNDKMTTEKLVWRAIYNTVAIIFQEKIELQVFTTADEAFKELQHFDAIYSHQMLGKLRFPPAEGTTPEVEEWIFQITSTWKAVMHASWCDIVLSPKQEDEYADKILDYLGRAAGASFQSTRLLRTYMLMYAATAQYDMAQLTLKQYVVFIKNNIRRHKTSGASPPDYVDKHDLALATLSMGMEVLSYYGNHKHIKFAHSLIDTALEWLELYVREDSNYQKEDSDTQHDVLARAQRAIGMAESAWAAITPFADKRKYNLDSAIDHHQRSVKEMKDGGRHAFTYYSLALAHVESSVDVSRLEKAGVAVKEAISILNTALHGYDDESVDLTNVPFCDEGTPESRRALLLRSWHLLVILLLHQKQHEAAFEVIKFAFKVYGGEDFRRGKSAPMSSFAPWSVNEKRRLIDLKMAEILVEMDLDPTSEGAKKASLTALELTRLYSILFIEHNLSTTPVPKPAPLVPPKVAPPPSSRRSIRKSLLSLPRIHYHHKPNDDDSLNDEETSEKQVTTVDALNILGKPQRHQSKKLQKRPSQRSITSRGRTTASTPRFRERSLSPRYYNDFNNNLPPGVVRAGPYQTIRPPTPDPVDEPLTLPYTTDEIGVAVTNDYRPPSPMMNDKKGYPIRVADIPQSDTPFRTIGVMLSAPPDPIVKAVYIKYPCIYNEIDMLHIPDPRFDQADKERRANAFESNMWLFIAGIYRKGGLYGDALDAIRESQKPIDRIWDSVADSESLSDEQIRQEGVAGMKSLGHITADNLAEKAQILIQKAGELDASDPDKAKTLAEANEDLGRAIRLCPNHLEATLTQATVLLDKYRPIYEAKMESGDPWAPIGAGVGLWPMADGVGDIIANLEDAVADRDLAIWYLKNLVESPAGWASLPAWQLLGEAREMAGEESAAGLAAERAIALGKGAYLPIKNVVGKL